jgi:predicted GNAT family acetyltransferase
VHARAGRLGDVRPCFGWERGVRGVRFLAMRLPPWPLLVSELDPESCEALVERWLREDPRAPGVSAVPATARAVAAAWTKRAGGGSIVQMREALHVLTDVIWPQRPPRGELRAATAAERELLVAWERAFVAEAGITPAAGAEAERTIARRLASNAQHLWVDERGQPVSTLAVSPRIAGTVRIGPVYTPPEQRNRGYASAAVATACAAALEEGAERCMLFTDLSNPTSNKIYAALGFQRCGDWEEHVFVR